MKTATFNKLALSLAIAASATLGGGVIEVQAQVQVMDARCPNGSTPSFVNNTLNCSSAEQFRPAVCGNPTFPRLVAIAEAAVGSERDVCASNATADGRAINSLTNLTATRAELNPCPAGFPTALQHNSGPLCLRTGVSFPANANLAAFVEGTDYRRRTSTQVAIFESGVDFERFPTNGVRNNFSYVQGIPAAATVLQQGWTLSLAGQGALNNYRRGPQPVSAILVPNL